MKTSFPSTFAHMANAVRDYCALIDGCEGTTGNYWLARMEKLLPRLHSAVLSLHAPTPENFAYELPNDDLRCELFMKLNSLLFNDNILWCDFDRADIKQCMCEALADDFADIYFDLKKGWELLREFPQQPQFAVGNWHSSFYAHWGQHLVDAESWLHALEARNYSSISVALHTLRTV
jgi:hypothetical protein